MNNIARSGNSHSLSRPNERNNQQRKDAHDDGEAPKRHQKPIFLHPVAGEKRESEREDAPQQTDHDQGVTSQLGERVDKLPLSA